MVVIGKHGSYHIGVRLNFGIIYIVWNCIKHIEDAVWNDRCIVEEKHDKDFQEGFASDFTGYNYSRFGVMEVFCEYLCCVYDGFSLVSGVDT